MVQPTFELSLKPLQFISESRLILCFPWAIASSPEAQILYSPHLSLLSGKNTHPMAAACWITGYLKVRESRWELIIVSHTWNFPFCAGDRLSDWHYHTCTCSGQNPGCHLWFVLLPSTPHIHCVLVSHLRGCPSCTPPSLSPGKAVTDFYIYIPL